MTSDSDALLALLDTLSVWAKAWADSAGEPDEVDHALLAAYQAFVLVYDER